MKFEVYEVQENSKNEYGPKKGDIRVKFPEYGEDYCTDKDENGELYFPVPNLLNHPEKPANRVFIGRIKDAFDTIMNGDGDVIQTSNLFGMKMISVIKFVDREYGEEMRQKFLDGWKNVKFGWGIEAGHSNSFSGFSAVCEDMTSYYPYLSPAENSVPLYFETEKEAKEKMSEIIETCGEYIERYLKAKSQTEQIKTLDEVENKYGLHSVYMSYILAECDSDEEKVYQFRVVQRVK